MSSIQNADVKSELQLQALGLGPENLIHDTKIWITSDGINQTLHDAIIARSIGLKGTAGGRIKDISVHNPDGESQDIDSVIFDDGETIIDVNWEFRVDSLIYVIVNGEHWVEYESDEITPTKWFRKNVNQNTISFSGDLTGADNSIYILNLEGVPPPSSAISVLEGAKPIHEAFGNTSNISSSSGVDAVDLVDFKTRITFNFDFENDDNLMMLFVNNEFFPRYIEGAINSKYYKIISSNTIELDGDYSQLGYRFYFAETGRKNVQDDHGNIVLDLAPSFRIYCLRAPNQTTWVLGVDDGGEIITNDLYDAVPDPIIFTTDDGRDVGLEIDSGGTLVINTTPSPGIKFTNMTFESPNGLVWTLGITSEDEIYVEDSNGQKFSITNDQGQSVYQIKRVFGGALAYLPRFQSKEDLPEEVDLTDNETALAFAKDGNGFDILYSYSNQFPIWKSIVLGTSKPVGHILDTCLSANEVASRYVGKWIEVSRGGIWIDKEDAEVIPDSYIEEETNDKVRLRSSYPNMMLAGGTMCSDASGGNITHIRAYYEVIKKHEQLYRMNKNPKTYGLSAVSRYYVGGPLNGNDSWVNDFLENNEMDPYTGITNTQGYGSNWYIAGETRSVGYVQMLMIWFERFGIKRYIRVK